MRRPPRLDPGYRFRPPVVVLVLWLGQPCRLAGPLARNLARRRRAVPLVSRVARVSRNRQAIESKLAYTEFLSLLIHDEVARRDQTKFALRLRLRRAAFRSGKSLEGFDFARLPNLNRALIHDLATGRYLLEKAPVLIVGPCGTGKSHLAQALGHCAVRQRRRALHHASSAVRHPDDGSPRRDRRAQDRHALPHSSIDCRRLRTQTPARPS